MICNVCNFHIIFFFLLFNICIIRLKINKLILVFYTFYYSIFFFLFDVYYTLTHLLYSIMSKSCVTWNVTNQYSFSILDNENISGEYEVFKVCSIDKTGYELDRVSKMIIDERTKLRRIETQKFQRTDEIVYARLGGGKKGE